MKHSSTLEDMNFYVEKAYAQEKKDNEENQKAIDEFVQSRPHQ